MGPPTLITEPMQGGVRVHGGDLLAEHVGDESLPVFPAQVEVVLWALARRVMLPMVGAA